MAFHQRAMPKHFIKLKALHKLGIGVLLVAVFTALGLTPGVANLFEPLEARALDYQFLLRGARPPQGQPPLIVLVDAAALDAHGFRSPTPRALLADIARQLEAKGARCAGFDFYLRRPHTPAQDDALEAALSQATMPLVFVEGAIEPFARHVRLGYAEVTADSRNRARGIDQRFAAAKGMPPLAAALYEACLGTAPRIPDDLGDPIMLIDHLGPGSRVSQPAPTFPVIAASELPAIPPALLRERIVLVGSGVEALGDIFFTPFSTAASGYLSTFGVELHATLVAMMLEQRWLRHAPPGLLGLLLGALLAVVALTSLFWRSLFTFLLGPVLALAWIVLAAVLFAGADLVLPIALPIALAALVFIICQTLLYFTESRYSRFLQTTFGRYMSPQVVAQMVDHSWGLELGGEERNLTILFSDIEGFTTVSEKLHPNQVVALLNEYLGTMTAVLFDEGATIGDFMGDGILAYFGAPLHMPDHAERACRAAVRMQTESVQLNERLAAMGFPPLTTRVGLHTGDVVVGNIGSDQRRDFTVIGDPVNLASRLEGVNKFFGTRVVLSEQTREQAPPTILTRELGRIVVKGKTLPVTLHEALGLTGQRSLDQAAQARYDTYAEGLQLFYAGNFPQAEAVFRRLADAGDPPAAYLAEQAAALQQTPPAGEWHGALTLTAK